MSTSFEFPTTWICHVCFAERPDARVSVYKRDLSAKFSLPAGSVTENIRYCNDRQSCIDGAPLVSFGDRFREKELVK